MANRPAQGGILFICAISLGQDAGCTCSDRDVLHRVSGDRRLCGPAAHGFRAKSLAHADTDRFPDTGICSHSQPDSDRDPERSDADQSQSDADSNSKTDRDSDPNAPVSRSECHTDAYAFASLPLTVFTVLLFLKSIEACRPQKQNPPAFAGGFKLTI